MNITEDKFQVLMNNKNKVAPINPTISLYTIIIILMLYYFFGTNLILH